MNGVLLLLYGISIGYVNYDVNQISIGDELFQDRIEHAYEIVLEPELVAFNLLHVKGTYTSQFTQVGKMSFRPALDTFEVDVFAKIKGVSVGYYHECVHPVLSLEGQSRYTFGGKDKFYIKFEGGF